MDDLNTLADDECELCEKQMPLTAHHLYPKDQHKRLVKQKKNTGQNYAFTAAFLSGHTAMICRQCHSAIHKMFTNRQLADRYYSIELLCEEDKVIRWVEYARKQRTYDKSDASCKGVRYAK